MHDKARRPGTRALAAAAFALTLFAPCALRAQTTRADARRNEMQMRQWALRNLEKLKNEPPEQPRNTRPTYETVEQNFEQLQLINYSLAGAALEGVALDYELIRKHAAEVRERASRLKGYLVLPEVEGQKAQPAAETRTPEGLRAAVASLDALVKSFAWNPVFRRPNVVNLEQSTKASRDLAGIIALSEQIRKGAAELSKGAKREGKK